MTHHINVYATNFKRSKTYSVSSENNLITTHVDLKEDDILIHEMLALQLLSHFTMTNESNIFFAIELSNCLEGAAEYVRI